MFYISSNSNSNSVQWNSEVRAPKLKFSASVGYTLKLQKHLMPTSFKHQMWYVGSAKVDVHIFMLKVNIFVNQ